jgi:membrane carboxypeptidase/penicillin-binding protein
MVLGSEVVTPLQMAGAYTAIAEGGRAAEPFGIREVAERTGRVLSRSDSVSRPVVSEDAAYLTLDLMRGVLARGTAGRARAQGIEGDFAGKTGTTNDKRDAWFVGFSPDLLALVWVGYDDNAETGLSGAEGALAIWIDFMKNSGASPASSTFAEPSGIERVWIDPRSGERAGDRCPEVFDEVFLAGTGPVDACPEHASGEADGEILSALDVHDRLFHRWRPEAEPVAMGAAPR